MYLKGCKVGDPDECIEVVAEDKMHVPSRSIREAGEDIYEIRCTWRRILLKEVSPPPPGARGSGAGSAAGETGAGEAPPGYST